MKIGQFAEDERDAVLKKIKSRKAVDLEKISPKVWSTRKIDDILHRLRNVVYKQKELKNGQKAAKRHSLYGYSCCGLKCPVSQLYPT